MNLDELSKKVKEPRTQPEFSVFEDIEYFNRKLNKALGLKEKTVFKPVLNEHEAPKWSSDNWKIPANEPISIKPEAKYLNLTYDERDLQE